jgi:hypothetical protein
LKKGTLGIPGQYPTSLGVSGIKVCRLLTKKQALACFLLLEIAWQLIAKPVRIKV